MLKTSTIQNKQYSFIGKKHKPEESHSCLHFRKELMPDSFKRNALGICNDWTPDPCTSK